jgi:hypothetical protein
MLQQLFHITIVSLTCIFWGIPLFIAFKKAIDKDDFWYHSWSSMVAFLFFLGCITISLANSWFGLLAPARFASLAIATVALIIYLLVFKRATTLQILSEYVKNKVSLSWVHILFVVIAIFLFVWLSSLEPVNSDTQKYHLQVIRWQQEYGTVPGIANLYPRVGLNSNWLNLISLFHLRLSTHENFTYLNAALVIWFFTWLFSTWRFHFQQMSTKESSRVLCLFYFLFVLYGLFDWQLFRDTANSTNFDFAVNAFLFIIFSYFIEAILSGNKRTDFSVLLLLFSFTVIGFKFSGIFIVFLVAYYLLSLRRFSSWLKASCIGLLVLLPVLIRNYITSGYPFFPGTVSIASPDWQFPRQMAERFYQYIVLSNKLYNHQLSFAYNFHLTAFNWIPVWFDGILLKHKIVLILALLSLSFLFVKTKLPIDGKELKRLIIVLFLMITGWFFTAPDPGRFGYAMLLTSAFLFIGLRSYSFFGRWVYNPLLIVTTLVMVYYVFHKSNGFRMSHMIVPAEVQNPGYTTLKAREVEFHLPNRVGENSDCRCYFTPLPCITQENPYLVPRGHSMKQGFRMAPLPDSNFILNYNY